MILKIFPTFGYLRWTYKINYRIEVFFLHNTKMSFFLRFSIYNLMLYMQTEGLTDIVNHRVALLLKKMKTFYFLLIKYVHTQIRYDTLPLNKKCQLRIMYDLQNIFSFPVFTFLTCSNKLTLIKIYCSINY